MEIGELVARLQEHKGRWPSIAREAGVSYSTVVRVATGETKLPAYSTFNRLRAAVRKS